MTSDKKRGYTILGSIGAIFLLLFLIILFFRIEQFRTLERRSQVKNLPQVKVMIAKPETAEVPLTLPSFLVGYNVTPILSRTNGYLKDFYVDIGDQVTKDQLLCVIDTPDVDAEWAKARGEYESFKSKAWIAKITSERLDRLYQLDPDAISKEEVDQLSSAYQSSVADVSASEANLQYWEILRDFKYVYAPFSGIIAERNIDIGSLISAGNESMTQPYTTGFEVFSQPLFKIIHTEVLRAFVEVPQAYYPYIEDGIRAEVTVPEYPNEIFEGVIDRNASALDQEARTLLTQVNIKNRKNLLRPGLYAEVKFSFKPYRDTFHIPVGALIIRDGPPHVALLQEDHTVTLQEVQIGRDFGKSIQIIKGIHPGDRIILNPSYRIKNGTTVHPLSN
jgi:RND family efflux transporter MFP subunit